MAPLHPTVDLSLLVPRYVTRFACIGDRCEDSCCSGWHVTLDKTTYDFYSTTTHPVLKPIFLRHVKRTASGGSDLHYGTIALDEDTQRCPALSNGLCSVQAQLDATHLSNTCAIFPRQTRHFAGRLEQALTLSCPEAARQALLHADAFDFTDATLPVRPDSPAAQHAAFGLDDATTSEVRIFCLGLMRVEGLALWERLAVLGVFCESLEALLAQDKRDAVPGLVREFGAVLAQGGLVDALRGLQANHEAQAKVFSTLLSARGFGTATPMDTRFVIDVGVNLGADENGRVDADTLVASYRRGLERLERALRDAPYVLEHYVMNEMFMHVFPFQGSGPFDAYLQLVARFGLLRLVLAARCNNQGTVPGPDALVATVHSYCRRFQHAGNFDERTKAALHDGGWSRLDRLYGFLRA